MEIDDQGNPIEREDG